MSVTDPDKLKALDTYNNGKFQRLNLLFAVNGGALLLAQFMFGKDGAQPAGSLTPGNPAFGGLTLSYLALGAIIFTILIVVDTWSWAARMKREFLGDLAFTTEGKVLLLAFGVLNIAAWALAGLARI
jgi:hypothetical protein